MDTGREGRLRILTANLWNGRADPDGFATLVERERADVVCLQELAPEQAEALRGVLPHGVFRPARDYTGMGIALRQPADTTSHPLGYRALHAARLDPKDWPGLCDPLAVWNVHMRAPHTFPPHRSLAIRRTQLAGLLSHVRKGDSPRLVLAGDFNATPIWPVYRRVARELEDAARVSAGRAGIRPARTWPHWPRFPRVRLLRIDHAFVRGVDVHHVRSLHIPGSDHDALCVDVAVD